MNTLNYKKQSGVVLVVSLVIMSVLTIVVLAVNSSTMMQEKMTAAVRHSSIALEHAEQALREAENIIEKASSLSDLEIGETLGIHFIGSDTTLDPFNESTWNNTNPANPVPNSATNGAKFFVEKMGTAFENTPGDNLSQIGDVSDDFVFPPKMGFRIIARGVYSPNETALAQRILVSYYSKRLD